MMSLWAWPCRIASLSSYSAAPIDFRSSMIRISFPPGAQQGRVMSLRRQWGSRRNEAGDVGTVGEEGSLRFVSPWGGTGMPRSTNAVLAQPSKSSAILRLTRRESLIAGSSLCSTSANPSRVVLPHRKCQNSQLIVDWLWQGNLGSRNWRSMMLRAQTGRSCHVREVQSHFNRPGSAQLQQGYLLGSPAGTVVIAAVPACLPWQSVNHE